MVDFDRHAVCLFLLFDFQKGTTGLGGKEYRRKYDKTVQG
jgi:hypothetical protein